MSEIGNNHLADFYKPSLALLTDLYQLTMAYSYWKLGRQNDEAVFHLYFRNNPFHGGYTVAAGLADAIGYLQQFRFLSDDLEYLAALVGNDGKALFAGEFLEALGKLQFTCDIDAVAEGTFVFPNEPILRVKGPIWQGQLLETPLLAILNFQTLIATKAARIRHAAGNDTVVEFGLRRAQGIDGAISATRASFIGGCDATSNVLAGKMFGIPVRGTHAHSWVMSFPEELEAFESYARAMPNNGVFLVDTYNTREGVRHAAKVGQQLLANGHKMIGIRLDSGDLAYLSIEARKILDEAGLQNAKIMATNDLDENIIASLKQQGAAIDIWGVGTKLVTAYDQPALGGIYKLGAIRKSSTEPWNYKMKVSEQLAKASTPGVLQVRRYRRNGLAVADSVFSQPLGNDDSMIHDPIDSTRRRAIEKDAEKEDLLKPIFRGGKLVYSLPTLEEIRQRVTAERKTFHPAVLRFTNPHEYPVGLESKLRDLRVSLLDQIRGV